MVQEAEAEQKFTPSREARKGMHVARVSIENFRGVRKATIDFDGHALVIGQNNVGKSTLFEALDLALGADRQSRVPVVDEYDFYNAAYLDENEEPVPIRIEVLLVNVTESVERACFNHLERWDPKTRKIVGQGELADVDGEGRLHLPGKATESSAQADLAELTRVVENLINPVLGGTTTQARMSLVERNDRRCFGRVRSNLAAASFVQRLAP